MSGSLPTMLPTYILPPCYAVRFSSCAAHELHAMMLLAPLAHYKVDSANSGFWQSSLLRCSSLLSFIGSAVLPVSAPTMFPAASLISLCLLAVVSAQQAGTQMAETHPTLPAQQCTASGCTSVATSVVLDSNWRWLHSVNSTTNCYTGNTWDATLCPDPTTCAKNCALDGADYSGTYGITTQNGALTLKFVTGSNVGSRVYLMANTTSYHLLQLLNQEFSFDVDMSNLGCGLNGALYLSEMPADGGISATNTAGAKYGTGYCDSQCPQDMKFINGAANIVNWTADATDANTGTGATGTCCNEMDIWEANKNAAAFTPHVCSSDGLTACTGDACGNGATNRYDAICDKDGCDFNSYRLGDQTFLGPGLTVDTNSKFTVVTQFVAPAGTLTQINRLYVQNGKVIQNSNTNIAGITPVVNSITDTFCNQQKTAFGDTNSFESRGGLAVMGKALAKGMVLALSIWDDYAAGMYWLDSTYPTNGSVTAPGVARGPCSTTSGNPTTIESTEASNSVIFSNIKWGAIGSTFSANGTTTTTTSAPTGPTQPTGGSLTKYSQCGGIGWTGSGTCVSGTTCTVLNAYYSQCL
ncbi:cellulase [Mycena maculata]|uniref:Glucanase n=1 Tax=Mycena maculata TaxID=230809 RepID=A0AAD7HS24_9AGAR|nr:cellulase [Mycena maculata]